MLSWLSFRTALPVIGWAVYLYFNITMETLNEVWQARSNAIKDLSNGVCRGDVSREMRRLCDEQERVYLTPPLVLFFQYFHKRIPDCIIFDCSGSIQGLRNSWLGWITPIVLGLCVLLWAYMLAAWVRARIDASFRHSQLEATEMRQLSLQRALLGQHRLLGAYADEEQKQYALSHMLRPKKRSVSDFTGGSLASQRASSSVTVTDVTDTER